MTVLALEALAGIALSLSVLMAVAWLVQQRSGNSGWVDTIWTFSVGAVGAGSALWPVAGAAPNARQWLVAALVADLVAAVGRAHRRPHRRHIGRSPLCRLRPRLGPRRAAQDVHLPAKSGDRLDSAGVCRSSSRRGFPIPPCGCRMSLGVADPVRRHRRRSARRRAAQALPPRSRQPGPGLRRRPVALVAPSELFLRMARLARLSRDRDLADTMDGAGRACWRRSSCTGSWSTSPASRRWKRRCCVRAASAIATTSRALAPSFRCRRTREWSHERGIEGDRHRRTGAAAGCHHSRRHPAAVLAHRHPAGHGMPEATPGSPTMAVRAIAEHADAANAQHYEVPAAFFARVLGPNRKYSSCFYKEPQSTLQEAEEEALRQTVEHADLADGQSILELGCGWGSLSLWMARQFPNSQVTAVSNSHSQRMHIQSEAAARGLANLRVITADMNEFDPEPAVRPHRVGRNVRAHDELARIAGAGAVVARRRRPLLHAHLHPPLRRLSVRSRRPAKTGSRSISSPAA